MDEDRLPEKKRSSNVEPKSPVVVVASIDYRFNYIRLVSYVYKTLNTRLPTSAIPISQQCVLGVCCGFVLYVCY